MAGADIPPLSSPRPQWRSIDAVRMAGVVAHRFVAAHRALASNLLLAARHGGDNGPRGADRTKEWGGVPRRIK